MMKRTRVFLGGVLGLTVALASCKGDTPTEPVVPGPSFSVTDPAPGEVVLCKLTFDVETTADFTVTATGGNVPNATLTLNAIHQIETTDECAVVWTATGPGTETVTITEEDSPGMTLFAISVNGEFVDPSSGSVDVSASSAESIVVFFKNEVQEEGEMALGRMTGGGRQITVGDLSVTRGFTIHCDLLLSNNLEINWPDNNKWHIDKPLDSATCLDNGDPTPPDAPFNTFIGEGTGRLNGVDGSVVRFTFVDNGEPGRNDQASFLVWAPGDDPESATPVLNVPLSNLDHGNVQAHFDQPHGNGRGR